jgi:hypothetical protein
MNSQIQMLGGELQDKARIRELLENWVLWSDGGFWDAFSTLWHEEADMSSTWCVASAREFIQARKAGWERGVSILHSLGGSTIDVKRERAVAMTKMTISQRGEVHGVLCDVLCYGRFYDFLSRVDGVWKLNRRRVIYEKDRMDPVVPGETLQLDPELLQQYQDGYRYLAYLQTQLGYRISGPDRPGMRGDAVEKLYRQGRGWLEGAPLEA